MLPASQKRLKNLEKLKRLVFAILADLVEAELDLGAGLVSCTLLAYFLLLFASVVDLRWLAVTRDSQAAALALAQPVQVFTCIYTGALVCLLLTLYRCKAVQAQAARLTKASVYLILFNTYIVFPLMVWSHIRAVTRSFATLQTTSFDYVSLSLFVVFVPCGSMLQFYTFYLQRNTIPSTALPLSVVSYSRELVVYVFNKLLVAAITIGSHLVAGKAQSVGFFLAGSMLVAAAVAWVLRERMFWSFSTNCWYVRGLLWVYCFKVCTDIWSLGWVSYPPLTASLVSFSFCSLASQNLLRLRSRVDFIGQKTSTESIRQGMLDFEKFWRNQRDREAQAADSNDYMYYTGLAVKLIERLETDPFEQSRKKTELQEEWHWVLLDHLLSHPRGDLELLELALLMQLIIIVPNLASFGLVFRRYRFLARKRGLDKQFKQFLIKHLIEKKIMNMYKGRIKDDDRKALSIHHFFQEMHRTEAATIEDNYLDIHLPIRAKNEYSYLCELVVAVQRVKLDLLSEISASPKLNCSKLFEQNKRLKRLNDKILRKIAVFTAESQQEDSFVSYYLAGAMVYLKTVRYDQTKSKVLFQMYKTKRQKLLQASVSGPVTRENLFKESAYLQVSVQKGSTGHVVDHSHDFGQFLGSPPGNASIIGVNCNDLFPRQLKELHHFYMCNMQKFLQLNCQRRWLLNGFDGELREIIFIVKIVPSVANYMTAVMFVRPKSFSDKKLLLLTDQHEFMTAHKGFLNVLEACNLDSRFSNLRELSRELCATIDLMRTIEDFLGSCELEKADAKLRAIHRDIGQVYSVLQTTNRVYGLEYAIDAASKYAEFLPGISIVANIELTSFKEMRLTKVYLSFKVDRSDPILNSVTELVVGLLQAQRSDRGEEHQDLKQMYHENTLRKPAVTEQDQTSSESEGKAYRKIKQHLKHKTEQMYFEDTSATQIKIFFSEFEKTLERNRVFEMLQTVDGRHFLKTWKVGKIVAVLQEMSVKKESLVLDGKRQMHRRKDMHETSLLIHAQDSPVSKLDDKFVSHEELLKEVTSPSARSVRRRVAKKSSIVRNVFKLLGKTVGAKSPERSPPMPKSSAELKHSSFFDSNQELNGQELGNQQLFASKPCKKQEPVIKPRTTQDPDRPVLVRRNLRPAPYLRKAALKQTFFQQSSVAGAEGEEPEEAKANSSHLITKILSKVMVS